MFEIRKDRAPQGRKKLLAERQVYLDLVACGVKDGEACRMVGIRSIGLASGFATADPALGFAFAYVA